MVCKFYVYFNLKLKYIISFFVFLCIIIIFFVYFNESFKTNLHLKAKYAHFTPILLHTLGLNDKLYARRIWEQKNNIKIRQG